MSYQEDFDIAQRYDLLCRASQSNVEQDGQRLQFAADLDVLDKIINHDLPELARSGSPDHFADILKDLNLELEHFREFCEFPDLAQKVVVGFGGAFSAGKSSLINTLLGKKRLVVEIDPTTSLPTYLLHGEQEQITAINLFRHRVILSQGEFASLTHEEKIKYGSQISGLLRSAFVSDPDFTWKNIALLDTPGYSKPDSEQWSERTDESVARSQLNLSNYIIWVVSATQGTISEDDLKFLTTLNADIPKLIVVSRADAKTPEDIVKIVALVKQTTAERGINVLDVIPVSARKKNDYPVQPIVCYLENWNTETKKLNFSYNFRKLFTEYTRYMQDQEKQATIKLEKINQIIFLSDDTKILEAASKLERVEQNNISNLQNCAEDYDELQTYFFNLIHSISEKLSTHIEQFINLNVLLSDQECSGEVLLKYSKIVDDQLLQIIYNHKNCPIVILEDLINKPIGSLSIENIEMLLWRKNIRENNERVYEHLEIFDENILSKELKVEVVMSFFLRNITNNAIISKIINKFNLNNNNVSTNNFGLIINNSNHKFGLTFLNICGLVYEITPHQDHNDQDEMAILSFNTDYNKVCNIMMTLDECKSNLIMYDTFEESENGGENILLCNILSFFYKNMSSNYLAEKFYLSNRAYIINEDSCFKLKGNLYISDELQLKISQNENVDIRCLLALNPFISEKTQLILAQDESIFVKALLYLNPYISEKIKLKVGEDYKRMKQERWIGRDFKLLYNFEHLIWPYIEED